MAASLRGAGPVAYRPMSPPAVAAGLGAGRGPDRAPDAWRALRRGPCLVLASDALAAEAGRLGLLERGGLARLLARAEPGAPRGRAA